MKWGLLECVGRKYRSDLWARGHVKNWPVWCGYQDINFRYHFSEPKRHRIRLFRIRAAHCPAGAVSGAAAGLERTWRGKQTRDRTNFFVFRMQYVDHCQRLIPYAGCQMRAKKSAWKTVYDVRGKRRLERKAFEILVPINLLTTRVTYPPCLVRARLLICSIDNTTLSSLTCLIWKPAPFRL